MHTMASDDTEITLGVGKLLGLFFLLAAICAVFFSIGYSFGHSSGREQAANDQVQVSPSSDVVGGDAKQTKPSPAVAKSDSPAAETTNPDSQTNLTFYHAVQQNSTTAQSQEQPQPAAAVQKVTVAETTPAKAPHDGPQVISHSSPVTGPGTIVVQIAALSREDDAVSLAGALRKKNYNVFVVNNPVNNDKFYHVQVGPFSDLADAQAVKAKLVAEGYNPILKK
jgi:DedD protein